jgi:hypothetical protein
MVMGRRRNLHGCGRDTGGLSDGSFSGIVMPMARNLPHR